ncbi:endothelin-converting enzyme homolog isoform X2 [Hydra vulgaris]|uniref:Endothelin-converting enzyme homolog isoform X2 n=1 Tax=Hydra vulgaris TaxID=6087 RepID=A0ABM4BGX8_HYDVU
MPRMDYNFNKTVSLCESIDDGEEVSLKPDNQDTIQLDTLGNEHADSDDNIKFVLSGLLVSQNDIVSSKDLKKGWKKYFLIGVVIFITILIVGGIVALFTLKKSQDKICLQQACRKENLSLPKYAPSSSSSSSSKITSNSSSLPSSSSSSSSTTTKNPHEKQNELVCETERCMLLAENLKKSINFSVDPCDDFHEFACGIWPATHPIPPSEAKLDTMGLLNLNKNMALRDIIEKQKNQSSGDGFKAKIIRFYDSCMNIELVEGLGSKPLKRFLSNFGKWSPVKSNGTNDKDITSLLIQSHQYFTPSVYDDTIQSPLFKSIVKVNDINSSIHILEFNTPDFPIPDPSIYLMDDSNSKFIREKYRSLMKSYVSLLEPEENADKVIEDIILFETELAKIAMDASFIRNVMQQYNLTTVKRFNDYVGSQIDWLRLTNGYFRYLNIKIKDYTLIGIRSLDYFKSLNELIAATDKRIVKDYIIWITVWKYGSYASSLFQEAEFTFISSVLGLKEKPDRWKKCIADIEQTMEFGLASLYVEKALTDSDKILATEILLNITNEFKKNLINVLWMDNSTKAKAFEKVNSIQYNIGYPDYVKNDTYLNILYDKVKVSKETYFDNVLMMFSEKRLSNLGILLKVVDKTVYDLPPTLVEAYFDPNKNKMVFLAGILQIPFYDNLGPMALNYGALGLVVGHEVTHAFDDLGRQFDKNGERKNWWSEASLNAFHERSGCMAEQYSMYSMYGINVNGNLTLGENIADNGGIKVAFLAYKKWQSFHGEEKRLPGIPLTMEQLLFVSHAQVWCGAYREEYIKRHLKIDYHSPAKYRVIGPLANLEEFSRAFNCTSGSTMNPIKKCRVW